MESIFKIPSKKEIKKTKNIAKENNFSEEIIKHKLNKIERETLTINYIDKKIIKQFKKLANENNYSQQAYFSYLIKKQTKNENN